MALAAVSLLWITQDMATWATVTCALGAAAGVAGACYFGWRHLRSRGNSR
ncbi:hypothetical protein ACWCQ0_26205 [Streptomyces massasporeus]|uniref:DUF2530 domain-containing protein n=1 Tax=Streptomyces massasporeus TaxID=67324 RepID=A0ABW6LJG0_9ACTN